MAGIFDRMTNVHVAQGEDSSETVPIVAALDPTGGEMSVQAPRTPEKVREAVQEMLKYGLLEQQHKPNLYRAALTHSQVVAQALEPLDLAMGIDEVRGLLYVTVLSGRTCDEAGDDWSHPLVRRHRFNLEQSLLIAILRQHFIAYEQESGMGAGLAQVAIDELTPQLQIYLGELGSEVRERNRALTLLDQLKPHGLVSAPDVHDRVVIRPIITHLANPENLQALIAWLRSHQEQGVAPQAEQEENEA